MYLRTCVPMYLCTYLPIDLSTYRPIDLSTYRPIDLSTYRPIDLPIYLSIHLSIYCLSKQHVRLKLCVHQALHQGTAWGPCDADPTPSLWPPWSKVDVLKALVSSSSDEESPELSDGSSMAVFSTCAFNSRRIRGWELGTVIHD